MNDPQRRLIIVSGLSGAGKSVALHALEDLDFFCIDNLPLNFLPEFEHQIRTSKRRDYLRVAIGIDARNPVSALAKFPSILKSLVASGANPELLFINAASEILIRRFAETRRKHPLSSESRPLAEAIAAERQLLEPFSEHADLTIDTSHTHMHELRTLIQTRVGQRTRDALSLQFISFGFKFGLPCDADFVFDVRCMPNPHWEPVLRDFSGRDSAIIEFLEGAPIVGQLFNDIKAFLDTWIPKIEADNRSYLSIACGCTGGRHRSVYTTEKLAAHYRDQGKLTLINHREL